MCCAYERDTCLVLFTPEKFRRSKYTIEQKFRAAEVHGAGYITGSSEMVNGFKKVQGKSGHIKRRARIIGRESESV